MNVDPQVMTDISKSSQRAAAALTLWLWSFLSPTPSLCLVFLYLISFSTQKASILGDVHLNLFIFPSSAQTCARLHKQKAMFLLPLSLPSLSHFFLFFSHLLQASESDTGQGRW